MLSGPPLQWLCSLQSLVHVDFWAIDRWLNVHSIVPEYHDAQLLGLSATCSDIPCSVPQGASHCICFGWARTWEWSFSTCFSHGAGMRFPSFLWWPRTNKITDAHHQRCQCVLCMQNSACHVQLVNILKMLLSSALLQILNFLMAAGAGEWCREPSVWCWFQLMCSWCRQCHH